MRVDLSGRYVLTLGIHDVSIVRTLKLKKINLNTLLSNLHEWMTAKR